MKKIISIIFLMALSFSLISTTASAKFKIVFGTKSHPDTAGNGCVGPSGTCVIVSFRAYHGQPTGDLGDNMGVAELSIMDDGKLKFDILFDSATDNKDDKFFIVERNIDVSEEVCRGLGLSTLRIKQGRYLKNYTNLQNGSVILDIIE
jgi:hypothetical protein